MHDDDDDDDDEELHISAATSQDAGASGGVGMAAVDLAQAAGAGTVAHDRQAVSDDARHAGRHLRQHVKRRRRSPCLQWQREGQVSSRVKKEPNRSAARARRTTR